MINACHIKISERDKFTAPPKIYGYSFEEGMIVKDETGECFNIIAKDINKGPFILKGFFLALELICNFRCPYCYTSACKKYASCGLSDAEVEHVLITAKNLGVQSIVIAGDGEPFLSRQLWKVIDYTSSHNMTTVIFTNGSRIDKKTAKKLHCHNISIILKVNSFDPHIQDLLIGVEHGHKSIYNSLDALLSVGFEAPRFAIQSVITKINMEDLREIYLFCRNNNVVPYFETYVAQGRGSKPLVRSFLEPNRQKIKEFFMEIQNIDEQLFNIKWVLYPRQRVLGYGACNKSRVMITISSKGDVYRCVTEPEKLGNIREQSLGDILSDPRVVSILTRNGCVGCKSVTL